MHTYKGFTFCVVFCSLLIIFYLFTLQFSKEPVMKNYKKFYDISNATQLQHDISLEEDINLNSGKQPENIHGGKRSTPPNIIFVLADDLGWADIGFHSNRTHTPYLDELARTGVKLGNYYAQPICSPSRACFLTGKYSDRTGIQHYLHPNHKTCLPLYHTTLPEVLKNNGYSTHLIGKWHLGYCREECLPYNRGFDTFFGMLGGSNDLYQHMKLSRYDMWDMGKPAYEFKGQYSAEVYASKAEDLIANYSLHNSGKPFFLFLSFQVPHEPQQVPRKYIEKWESYSYVTRSRQQKLFGQISCMDEMVNKVVFSLQRNALWDNTVLIFSSDNGGPFVNGASNFPFKGQKGNHFDGGTRVVGFVNSPLLPDEVRGTTHRGLMGMADWFPTFVEGIAGGKMGRLDLDGINVWDSIREGQPSPREEYILSVGEECLNQSSRNNTRYWDRTGVEPRTSIRRGPWKLIIQQAHGVPQNAPAEVLLFNVENDIGETQNLAYEYPDVVRDLRQRVREYCHRKVPIVTLQGDSMKKPKKLVAPWGCVLDEDFVRNPIKG
ncbi:Arylsulfatase B [Holothuria leucospilota]|uniref:Arylsulfatase B n=1 Tax=Holothuria leucospilota TaxID=206669 RepID=A0A9Q1BF91_HOLLE|nr:Arylsulfatase B [Holothuria leucospilota]